jgi:hypothetical protein
MDLVGCSARPIQIDTLPEQSPRARIDVNDPRYFIQMEAVFNVRSCESPLAALKTHLQ